MASQAEVDYWRERALFYERRLAALGEGIDFPAPPKPPRTRWWETPAQMSVDDCIAEVERGT